MTEQLEKYLADKVDVFINYNNDAGAWYYSVAVAEDSGFWLDSFNTEEEAIKFCKDNNLTIKE